MLDGSDPQWPIVRFKCLAYAVGVLLKGDGSVFTSRERRDGDPRRHALKYIVALRVKSRLFAETFRRRFAHVLARKPVVIQGPVKDGCFLVTFVCADFARWWLSQSFRTLKAIARRLSRNYLQGRFDSESNVANYEVYMCGAEEHRSVLEFDLMLCKVLGMRVGRIAPYGQTGVATFIHGKMVNSRMQRLRFSVNASDFLRVLRCINVEERNMKLRAMIKGRRWKPWNGWVRREAVKLHNSGRNLAEIQKELLRGFRLDVPYDTLDSWLKRGSMTWKEYTSRRLASQLPP